MKTKELKSEMIALYKRHRTVIEGEIIMSADYYGDFVRLLDQYAQQPVDESISAVTTDWTIKQHQTDLGQVMKSEQCRFIGTLNECVEFIKTYFTPSAGNIKEGEGVGKINRLNDEEIINITNEILSNGNMIVETPNEAILVKLMEIRGTPIRYMKSLRDIDYDFRLWTHPNFTERFKDLKLSKPSPEAKGE